MLTFFRAGGFSMWFVLLLGAATLVSAILFILRADVRRLAIVRALTWATVFQVASGVCSNFLAVMWNTTTREEIAKAPDFHLTVMYGLGEAVAPAVLGCTLLSVCWLLVAVGTRRAWDRDNQPK